MLEKPLLVARGFTHRFSKGNDPFQRMTRLLEECGERAQSFEWVYGRLLQKGHIDPPEGEGR